MDAKCPRSLVGRTPVGTGNLRPLVCLWSASEMNQLVYVLMEAPNFH